MLVDINLLPEKERERSVFLVAALGVISAALLVWLVLFLLARSLTDDTERLDDQLINLQATQAELSARLNRSDTAQAHDELAASVQWAENYRYETAPLLEDLTAQLPRRGFFRSFAFAAPHQATVEVQFDDKTEAAYYLTRIQASEAIQTASLESVETEEIEDTADTTDGGTAVIRRFLPRYIAVYTVFFNDPRGTLDGAAPAVPEETPPPATDAPPEADDPAADGTVPDAEPPADTEQEGSDAESD